MTEELSLYIDKCRCCLGSLEGEDTSSLINKIIEKRFHLVSEIELKSSSLLSKRVCMDCHTKLGTFFFFKQEIVNKQEKLYQLLEEGKIHEQIEELEDEQSYYGEVSSTKLEPDVDIKTEVSLEVFKINEVFESIDYDDQSAEQLSYDQYEALDIPKPNKRRKRRDPFREASEEKSAKKSPETRGHSCPVCQKFFNDKKKVKIHIQRVHKQIKDHKCNECDYKAHTKWDILRHIKANHMPQDSDPKDLRICPDCGKVLKGNNHLNFHIKTKHLKLTKYSCDLCDFKSYGKYEIRSHIEIHHLPLELRKGFPCDLCPSVLTTAMSLKTHKTHKHSGLKPHQCFCGKSYALRETLKSHIRNVHNGERKYKCPHCDKGFNSNPRLRDHINNTHGTKQEIPCDECGKVFNSLRNVQTHMIYHQNPTLKCNYCDKVFYIKKNLREHQESVHLGITYTCDQCSRSFQSTSGLRRHSKSHCKS